MPVTAAVAVPHPPIILPEVGKGEEKKIQKTADAYFAAMRFVAAAKPQAVVIISPHAELYADWFHISPGASAGGSFAQFRAPGVHITAPYDEALAAGIEHCAQKAGLPAGRKGRRDRTLDHGTMIPLYFLRQVMDGVRVVRMGLSALGEEEHYRLGMCIAAAAGDKRVAVIASGDLAHRLKEDGPYGYRPEGPKLDKAICDALAAGDFGALMAIDPALADAGAECGLRSFVMMAGALDARAVEAKLCSYEDTFGVGYAVATFAPGAPNDERAFLEKAHTAQRAAAGEKRQQEDAYVKLARRALEAYLETGARTPAPANVVSELANRRAGVFVSLHKRGQLRGCIGTIAPTTQSVAQEIWQNAVSAAAEDPRFLPVRPEELDGLVISVDVLGEAEAAGGLDALDPQRYGVIVSAEGRRGLLLPALDGVGTAEEQVDIARRKAGIAPGTPVKLERFEVVRHGSH